MGLGFSFRSVFVWRAGANSFAQMRIESDTIRSFLYTDTSAEKALGIHVEQY